MSGSTASGKRPRDGEEPEREPEKKLLEGQPEEKRPREEIRVMLVTGASRGVGEAIVRHYAQKGWKVAAVARGEERLRRLCGEVGENAVPFPCDVSDLQQVLATVAKVLETLGPIDVLVNNAGVSQAQKKFWELSAETIGNVVDINLKGVMYMTHTVLQRMVAANRGRIFGIASVAGLWGIPLESCYVASKHGMVGFMDAIANETRSTNVVVSTICTGGIDTPWWNGDHPYGKDQTNADGTTKMLIQPQEIVDLMDYQLKLPTNRVHKRVVVFPKNEWH